MKHYIIRTPIGPCVTESDSYRIQDGILTLHSPTGPVVFKDWYLLAEISEESFKEAMDKNEPSVDLEGVEVGGEA